MSATPPTKDNRMTLTIIGSGNVAWLLAILFKTSGHKINQIYSRNKKTGSALSKITGGKFIDDIQKIDSKSDIYIIAINDDSIAEVVSKLPALNNIVVHTSGTVDLQILKKKFKKAGVVYPLQSITSESVLSDELTFCLEATNNTVLTSLKQLVTSVNCSFVVMNSQKRAKLHLAAVLVNNFTNHLYAQAFSFLKKNRIEFNLLKPLISHTVKRINGNPASFQTGPAVRNDKKTIQQHLMLLKDNKQLADLYKQLTASIYKFHKK